MTTLRILHVDDSDEFRRSTADLIQRWSTPGGLEFDLVAVKEFGEALAQLAQATNDKKPFDVLLLDIANSTSKSDRSGIALLRQIKRQHFVEVIIYSAHAEIPDVKKEMGLFVKTLRKASPPQELKNLLLDRAQSKPLSVRNQMLASLSDQLSQELVAFLWPLAVGDEAFFQHIDSSDLVSILSRRLAVKLASAVDLAEPFHYYVRPPLTKATTLLGGDLVKGRILGQALTEQLPYPHWGHDGYWVVVTASCDLERGKAHNVTLAVARPLEASAQYENILSVQKDGDRRGQFKQLLLNNNNDDIYILPEWFDIPWLVVDLESTVSIPLKRVQRLFELTEQSRRLGQGFPKSDQDELKELKDAGLTLERIASLNSPFGEHLTSRFGHKYGRIGVAGFNLEPRLSQLQTKLEQEVTARQAASGQEKA